MQHASFIVAAAAVSALTAVAGTASGVIVPDNGFGTATIPPPTGVYNWDAISQPWAVVNGLPAGSTLRSLPTAEWGTFVYGSDVAGGGLGGNHQTFTADLDLHFVGSGVFAGYMRSVTIATACQTDTAPRVLAAPVQSFDNDLFQLQGQISGVGDPDFDLLRVTAGTNFGMPSPGHTTLTAAGPGLWQVDSFFDIMYRIDFVGHPGGPFGGMSGSTTAVTRMIIGAVPAPASGVLLALGGLAAARRRRS